MMAGFSEDYLLAEVPVAIVARWPGGVAGILNVNQYPGVRVRLLEEGRSASEYEAVCVRIFGEKLQKALFEARWNKLRG